MWLKFKVILIFSLLVININTVFALDPFTSINQTADFVDVQEDPYAYVNKYNTDEEFKKWFDEKYNEYASIYKAVGLEDPVIITESNEVIQIIFDGKWTSDREWKQSAADGWLFYDGNGIVFRSSHDRDNLYFLVDFISDRSSDRKSDRAIICLDGNNDKTNISENNDYCFIASLGSNTPIILKGGSKSAINGHFDRIFYDGVIVAGSMSDYADRYSPISHTSYEFKIPTELVGRYSEYGLYIAVYNYDENNIYPWPRNIKLENNFTIPPPSVWGEMISVDKSLPEFNMPTLLMVLSLALLLVFTKVKNTKTMKNLY
jgi:hypothetical protein